MDASSSLASVDPQQSIAGTEALADVGYAAVEAAYRFTVARAGAETALRADALRAHEVLIGSLEAIAHLCDRLAIHPASVFEAALDAREHTISAGFQEANAIFGPASCEATFIRWSEVDAPRLSPDAHTHTVLTLLNDRPDGVTSAQLRDLGVKNPSNVVMNLIRAGHPISRIQVTRGGAKGREALYVLDRAKA